MKLNFKLAHRTWAVLVAALAAMGLIVASEHSYQRSLSAMNELASLHAVRTALGQVMSDVINAETSQRGYLLTGRDEYLGPYRSALATLPSNLATLEQHGAMDATSSAQYKQLKELVARRLALIGALLRLHGLGQHERWRELLMSNFGKDQSDEIRSLVGDMLARRDKGMVEARAAIDGVLQLSRVVTVVLVLISLLVLAVYLRQRRLTETTRNALREQLSAELRSQVAEGNRELSMLAQHLLTAREDERSRLARALHDELGALLTAAKLDTARIKTRVATSSPPALACLAQLNETLNSIIGLTRRITEDLRPSSLGNLGLVAALETLAREFAAGAELSVDCDLQTVVLTAHRELTVFRLVQEALTNISKYAKARQVRIVLRSEGDHAVASVTDDGIGFELSKAKLGSYGLLGMRYRVEGDGGLLQVMSAQGAGTQLQATLPLGA